MTPKQETKQRAIMTVAHENYGKKLSLYALFRVQSKATSEDLVQDTFRKTWSYLVRGGKIDIMKSFLYHILKNLIIDEYRKRKTSSLDELMANGLQPSEDNSDRLVNMLDGKRAMILIAQLPEKYQKVMKMRYVQELTLKEMALITGQSKETIAVQLHRGLEKLKILYSPPTNNLSPPSQLPPINNKDN
ncbi:MAG: RNA polymerase sigma factor [Patescibacteria group bacterium]